MSGGHAMYRSTTNPRISLKSFAAVLLVVGICLTSSLVRAELVSRVNNVVDTDTGLEWRTFEGMVSQGAYNAALAKYDAGSTYRLPTAAEVDALLDKLFPGFVANDATGRCALGAYPAQLAQAQAFKSLFGGDPFNGMYADASGQLKALHVHILPYSGYGSRVCLTGLNDNYEQYRNAPPPYPVSNLLVMVVRDAVDVKVPVLTLYDYIAPADAGFGAENYFAYDTDREWSSYIYNTYCCTEYTSFGLGSSPGNYAAGQAAPWVRLRSIDYTPFPSSGGVCQAGDANLGNGFCRHSFVGNYWPWHFAGASGVVPGSSVDNRGKVDNVVVEQIWDNMTIDYAPSTTANTIRPKNAGWSIYVAIKTTNITAGDDYDFNAADVDPATLKLGKGLAPSLEAVAGDVDGDGDTDYTFRFNTGATAVTCLDSNLTLAGYTYAGAPLAGHDTVAPIGCTETVLMDIDPFNTVNTIRPNDNYNVTVAVLGMRTSQGDAVNLYPGANSADGVNNASLKFGPAETTLVGTPILTDIDGDTNQDMLVNFNVFNAGIACGDTEAQLTGSKNSGIPIMAADSIVTTECETGGCHP